MDPKLIIGIVVLVALGLGGYLWYNGLPDSTGTMDDSSENTVETGDASSLAPDTLEAEVTGSWQSTDDSTFTRTFRADGTVTDRYDDNPDVIRSGGWEAIANGEGLPAALSGETRTILRISFPEEALFLVVTKLTEEELALTYASGSGTLHFTRVAP